MMPAVIALLALVACLASIAAAPLPAAGGQGTQDAPTRDASTPRTGTGAIRGRVTAKADGAPVSRAMVSVGGAEMNERPLAVETDDAGRYEFTGLAQGDYFLSVRRRGYVQPSGGRSVGVRDGQVAGADVVLERAGTISGRVFDEFGEPMADVRVEALLVLDDRPQASGRSRETDDEGRFRLFELQSGKYVLRAEPPGSAPAITPAGHAGQDALAYTPAFAPGVPDAASAQVVVVGTTRDATGMDIRLSKQRTYRVSGTVLDSRGLPLRNGYVNYSRDTGGGGRSGMGIQMQREGHFTLEGLTAGEYWIEIGTGLGEPEVDRENEGEYARQTLAVQGDIDDLTLVTRPTATVTGEVVFEGGPVGAARYNGVLVGAIPTEQNPDGILQPTMATVREDRHFTLRRLAGPSVVRKMSRDPQGWWLRRVMYKGEDVTDTPTEFRSSAPGEVDLQALFTNRVAQASGTVTDTNGRPVGGAWVLAFVDGRRTDLDQHSADRMAIANERGVFRLLGLIGDTYGVVAFEPQRQPPSSSLFKRLTALATSMTVTPGESRVINLKVTDLPEP